MQDVSQSKKLLRIECKKLRTDMSRDEKKKADTLIQGFACELIFGLSVKQVLCYVSSSDIEVRTIDIINELLLKGIQVVVPKSIPDVCGLEFYSINDLDSLKRGFYNILEPDTDICQPAKFIDGAVCIVPGLAFDRKGRRLGFGKGYYDRFLTHGKFIKVGLCYDCCLYGEIPHNEYDSVMDYIITEKGGIDL